MATTDAWKHRSTTMRCGGCMYFVPKDGTDLGRCRRHAPTMSGFPAVFGSADWCGDHKLDHEKVLGGPAAGGPTT